VQGVLFWTGHFRPGESKNADAVGVCTLGVAAGRLWVARRPHLIFTCAGLELVQTLIAGLQLPNFVFNWLNFSPNRPHSTAKLALLKIKFLQFRLRIKI
jgi:hypothetical protein